MSEINIMDYLPEDPSTLQFYAVVVFALGMAVSCIIFSRIGDHEKNAKLA